MDYEKAYKEAQKWIESIYPDLSHEQQMEVEAFFPELKESEDEKIRKDLIAIFKGEIPFTSEEDAKRYIAWLEKQDEKLPVGFYYVNSEGKKFYSDTFKYGDVTLHVEKQGEQKLAWSEEDEHRVKDAIYFLDTAKKHYASTVELDACINWLESLKDRVTWKPSEEQISLLQSIVNEPNNAASESCQITLKEVIKQLKKLK